MSGIEVKAVAKYVRISPQKVRKLVGAVKGKPVETGLDSFSFMPQKGRPLSKSRPVSSGEC